MSRKISGDAVRAYLARDWEAARANKRAYWRDRLERGGLPEALRVTEQLRVWMLGVDPDWPSKEDREEDLETHRRVAETFARAAQATATKSKLGTAARSRPRRVR